MGGKSSSSRVQVVDYNLSLHIGVCWGPVDSINYLKMSDKEIAFFADENATIDVSLPELFGGPKQGGGIAGKITAFFGGAAQIMPTEYASKLQRTPTTMPAYRGLTSLLFLARAGSTKGFTWGSNNPVLPGTEVNVTRAPRGLPGNAMIGPDANLAHIIYECVTNTDWGLGRSGGLIDLGSFVEAASVFEAEGLGISLEWKSSIEMGQFVETLLSYGAAHFFMDPAIGKWRLKLVRPDYDPAELQVVDPSVARMVRFDRGNWGETINEVQVQWTDPRSGKVEIVRAHDDANIRVQGGVVSDTKNYEGVRNPELALRLALRDLQHHSSPLARAEMDLNRSFWSRGPGDCLRLQWPEEGLSDRVFRILKVERGTTSEQIRVNLVEDIFSSPFYQITAPTDQWVDPSTLPLPVYRSYLGSIPYFLLAQRLGDAAAQEVEYPSTYVMVLADVAGQDVRQVDYQTEETLPTGVEQYIERGSLDPTVRTYVDEDTNKTDISSVLTMAPGVVADSIQPADFLLFMDDEDPEITETMLVTAVDPIDDEVTVLRGVLDTIPRIWSVGATVWIVRGNQRIVDGAQRSVGATEQYKLLPVTTRGRLSINDAPEIEVTPSARHFLPYRPAYPRINSNPASVVSVSAAATTFVVNWYRRNRLAETAVVLSWSDLDGGAEPGQTTTVRVLDSGGMEVVEYAGETGVSKEITLAAIGSPSAGATFTVELFSERDGYESFQRTSIGLLIIA
jgi:hypothetical protein